MKYAFVLEASLHAELSASATERWATCTGSPSLIRGLPNHSTLYAATGTAAHHIGAECLRRKVSPDLWHGKMAKVEGHEIRLDEELCDAVQEYLDDIAAQRQPGDIEFVEQSFTEAMRKLHPKFGGSSDFTRVRIKVRHLLVEDYKHGAGVAVDVDDNKQLKYYALGSLLSLPQYPIDDVEIRIAQPRCDHEAGRFRSFHFKALDLLEFAADLIDAAKETEDFTLAKLVPSKKACRFCPANAANMCPAIIKERTALIAADFNAVDPARYSKEQIAEFLHKAPLVEASISAMREFAYQESLRGEKFPGWKIVAKKQMRKYIDEEAAAQAVAANPACFTEPELKSPAQIEKTLGKKAYDAIIAPHVEKKSSGFTLAPDADPRPPAQVAQLTDFDVVSGNAEEKQ